MLSSSENHPKLSLVAALVAVLACGVFLVVMAQVESGRYFSKTVTLERQLAKSEPSGEFGHRITLPKKFRDDERIVEQAIVLEDGVPLPLKIEKIKHVGGKGKGRYRLTQKSLYFSTPDNSDPQSNGRHYQLRAPRTLRPALVWIPLVLLTVALWYLSRSGLPHRPNWHQRPWVEPVLVFGVSLVAMFWSLTHFSNYSDGWLIIDGTPFSDGIGWVELGKSLSEGRGFSGAFEAHRGGYPILLGSFFSLTGGASVLTAKLFNVLMLAFGSTAIYLLARDAFGRGVAILVLLGLITSTRFGILTQMTITEPVGFALAAIGLQQFFRACQHPAAWRFLVVGIFLGLSNLVRPFTLLALPIFGALILWLAWQQRWGWRRFSINGIAYVGGAMLIFGPWVARQKIDWGVPTLDLNSAVMLYGAAAKPGEGEKRMLSARHYIEGDEAGFARDDHGPRYHYYMGRFKESVGEDPGDYFGFLAGRFVEFFSAPGFADGHVREQLAIVFFFALLVVAWRRRFAPLILLAGMWPLIGNGMAAVPPVLVVLGGVVLGLVFSRCAARMAILILTATLCGAGVLNAMVGNFALNRGTVFIEWIVFLLVSAGVIGIARFVSGDRVEVSKELPARDHFSDAYPVGLLAVLLLGFTLVVGKSVFGGKPDIAAWKLSEEVKAAALAEVSEQHAGVAVDELFVSRVQLGDYRWRIGAGEDRGHWARQFEVRSFERTVAMPLVGYGEKSLGGLSTVVNIPGDQTKLDGRRDFILVGLRNRDDNAELGHGKLIVEALALIPYDPLSGEVKTDAGLYFEAPNVR